ncbi:MAG: hypothetical protein HQK89_05045 [Nitrospirae bacterium]|nr:hypothetical protein [Nitrospirota bacterium]
MPGYRLYITIFLITLFFITLVFINPAAAEMKVKGISIIGIEELRPGMRGYGLTVFKGTEPEKFKVEVVDIVAGQIPGKKNILIKTEEKRHLFGSGVSGSPVYFDNRLAGAIYATEEYQIENILHVMPIQNMLDELEKVITVFDDKNSTSVDQNVPSTDKNGAPDISVISVNNFKAVSAPKAGEMIFVPLVRGDIWIGSAGTVTTVDGNILLAFGHPNLFTGDNIILPMHKANVNSTIPKMNLSYKMAAGLAEIGAVVWDGKQAIIGQIGRKASMIPLKVSLKTLNSPEAKIYNMEIIRKSQLISKLIGTVISSLITSNINASTKEQAISVNYSMKINGLKGDATFSQRYDADSIKGDTGPLVSGLILTTLFNGLGDKYVPDDISIGIEELADGRTGNIRKADFNKSTAHAGDTVTLNVEIEHSLDERMVVPIEIVIPEGFNGTFPVSVVPGNKVRPSEVSPDYAILTVDWLKGVLRSDDVVVMFPSGARATAFYPISRIDRTVIRLPWAVTGASDATINIIDAR